MDTQTTRLVLLPRLGNTVEPMNSSVASILLHEIDALPSKYALQWVRLLINERTRLPASDYPKLLEMKRVLTQFLTSDKHPTFNQTSYRSLLSRVDDTFLELACLLPGVEKRSGLPTMKLSPIDYLVDLETGRPDITRSRSLASATSWLQEAYRTLDALALVPDELRKSVWPNGFPLTKIEQLAAYQGVVVRGECFSVYASLSDDCACELVERAVQYLEMGQEQAVTLAAHVLKTVACLIPNALLGHHVPLIKSAAWAQVDGIVFQNADEQSVELLLNQSVDAAQRERWLLALAWAGRQNRRIVDLFSSWDIHSPKWASQVNIPPVEYSLSAGWAINDGQWLDLVNDQCFAIVEMTGVETVRVEQESSAICSHCHAPLVVVFELTPDAIAASGLAEYGAPTSVVACYECDELQFRSIDASVVDGVFFPVGRVEQCPSEGAKSYSLQACKTPLEPLLHRAIGWVGGHPNWIDDPWFPLCEKCEKPMGYFAQVELSNATYYSFCCPLCAVYTTIRRCT